MTRAVQDPELLGRSRALKECARFRNWRVTIHAAGEEKDRRCRLPDVFNWPELIGFDTSLPTDHLASASVISTVFNSKIWRGGGIHIKHNDTAPESS